MSFWSKKIKSTKDAARVLGEDVEKVKALKDGDLEIGGETMDRVVKTLRESEIQDLIKKNDIWKWILDTDFKEKRKEFGYSSQREVAHLIKCDQSIICNLENHKDTFKRLSPKLIDVYNFYTNDFNKKINKKQEVPIVDAVTTKKNKKSDKISKKKILKWYKDTDIRALRGETSQRDMAIKIGCAQSSLSDIENKRLTGTKLKALKKVYIYFNSGNSLAQQDNLDKIYNWYTSIEDLREYRRQFGYSSNKMMAMLNASYDQVRDFEKHKYKSATPVVCKFYNFYHDENNRLEPIIWNPSANNVFAGNKQVEEKEETVEKPAVDIKDIQEEQEAPTVMSDKDLRIIELEEKCKSLERQIYMYEKLISKL